MMNASAQISVNPFTGSVVGANAQERLALFTLKNAAWALRPVHDFGFSVVAKAVRRVLPSTKSICVDIGEAGTFAMPYCDPYWGRLLYGGWRHEPEIINFIEAMRHVDYLFIDGGANYGYWSVIVSSKACGAKPTVAIEAATDTYTWLEANQSSNHDRFEAMNRALGSQRDQIVRLYGAKHEARTTVAPDDGADSVMEIKTTTLDDLADRFGSEANGKFVVKLDVEGVEVDVLKGSSELANQDTLIIYEEHGKDDDHEVSSFIKDAMGCRIFWFGDTPSEITDLSQIRPIKKSKRHGYNFVATKSRFWLDEIDAAMARMRAS